jgi:hypothetical protein
MMAILLLRPLLSGVLHMRPVLQAFQEEEGQRAAQVLWSLRCHLPRGKAKPKPASSVGCRQGSPAFWRGAQQGHLGLKYVKKAFFVCECSSIVGGCLNGDRDERESRESRLATEQILVSGGP